MLQRLVVFLIHCYRYTLSYVWGRNCRFYPTCSKYALEAIENFGVRKGMWLTCKRLCRCHPFCAGGYDPLPSSTSSNPNLTSEIKLS